jgi:hypothetical protein
MRRECFAMALAALTGTADAAEPAPAQEVAAQEVAADTPVVVVSASRFARAGFD